MKIDNIKGLKELNTDWGDIKLFVDLVDKDKFIRSLDKLGYGKMVISEIKDPKAVVHILINISRNILRIANEIELADCEVRKGKFRSILNQLTNLNKK